jgi:GMP reductase
MKYVPGEEPAHGLTFAEVYIVPGHSDIESRSVVDTSPRDSLGMHFPVVVANMNAIAGDRMAETVARRGGLAVLPQDLGVEAAAAAVANVKGCNTFYETPVIVAPNTSVDETLDLMLQRAHNGVVITEGGTPESGLLGVITEQELDAVKGFDTVMRAVSGDVPTMSPGLSADEMFAWFGENKRNIAPVVQDGRLLGVLTRESIVRSILYKSAVDKAGQLLVAVAVGINGQPERRAAVLREAGADVIVVDTAHGDQSKTQDAISKVRREVGSDVPIVAGNIVTGDGTKRLISAGADIVKVGVGPGAMCTTRRQTGVGRPQFSAVAECAAAAGEVGGYIWADGGIKYPSDVAKALGAGASSAMIGSWFAGTAEAAAPMVRGDDGTPWKENHGMASSCAVNGRNQGASELELALAGFYVEGIHGSRHAIDPDKPGVESILDEISAGLRSAMTYSGARTLAEFHENVVFGTQSNAGFAEGMPRPNGSK